MRRRDFLTVLLSSATLANVLRGADVPKDFKITRAVSFQLPSRRSKVAGKNARLDVHGDRASDRMVRLFTNHGVEGLGNCRADEKAVVQLLGKNPLSFHDEKRTAMTGPLGAGTMPLWDLAGKVLGKPVYELLRSPTLRVGSAAEKVPVYDGSIYFADLLSQYADRWVDRFREEIDMGLKLGHRGFKIKVGRGNKWMPRADGDARDIEVVKTIRQHAGPDITLNVDANNGYDLAGAKRFLEHVGPLNLGFVEELFPETVDECLALKEFMKEHGWKTLLADGETQKELSAYRPFIDAKAIDVFQGDMNHFGVEGILTESRWAEPQGLSIARTTGVR
jgi:D-galactarolactone cycloisomerase